MIRGRIADVSRTYSGRRRKGSGGRLFLAVKAVQTSEIKREGPQTAAHEPIRRPNPNCPRKMLHTSSVYRLSLVSASTAVARLSLPPSLANSVRAFSTSPASKSPHAPPAERAAASLPSLKVDPGIIANAPSRHVLQNLEIIQPKPLFKEMMGPKPVSGQEIESWDIAVGLHRVPATVGDRVAKSLVIFLRFLADTFFRERYVARGVMLETVAAIPGQVAGSIRHLTSLRKIRHDGGWWVFGEGNEAFTWRLTTLFLVIRIAHLLHEAENERMHLMTWEKMLKPSALERTIVLGVQGVFWNAYFFLYLFFPKTSHRFVGYLEEEAVVSYTHMLEAIDNGKLPNEPAPQIAKDYWHLPADATLRDVVLAIRADEANHRDVNHFFSDKLAAKSEDLRIPLKQDFVAQQAEGRFADREKTIPRIDLVPKH